MKKASNSINNIVYQFIKHCFMEKNFEIKNIKIFIIYYTY